MNVHYFTDTTTSLTYTGDGDLSGDDGVDTSGADTVTRGDHWADFFDTDQFVRFDATLAQPIDQPYVYNGELKTFRKEEDELRNAQAQIDNMPWTMGHPPRDRVEHASQIRGVWTNPRWSDGQVASVDIPANDPEAIQFAVEHDEVSIGFSGVLDWVDDGDVDAVQRDIAYDHGASVENGRCPPEDGCGLHTDAADHGHVLTDSEHGVRTQNTEDASNSHQHGDWVRWESSGGTAHGRIDEIVRDGCTTRGKGDREVCAEDGDPAVVVEVYDDETGESTDEMVRHKLSTLNSWSGPTTDGVAGCPVGTCSDGPCSCGLHVPLSVAAVDEAETLEELDLVPPETAQDAAQTALDHREDTDAMNATGWNRAEQLANGEELSPADIADGTDGMANWWARHRPHTVSSDGDSLQRDESKDRVDDHSWIAGKGWGGIPGMNWAMRMKDKIEEIRSSSSTSDSAHPDGIYVEDGNWYGVGPSENPDDEPKYELNNCNDVKDAFNLRNNGDYDIDTETLVARIKRAAESHECSSKQKPWTDSTALLADALAQASD